MSLATTIADEISARHGRRAELDVEIDKIDQELEQLRTMEQLAQSLNGNGTMPAPVEPSRTRAKSGGRSLSAGRNGGDAPGGRRPTSGRKPGSAPSGKSAPAHTSSSPRVEGGGAKRAAVLAFIQANGRVKTAEVAAATGLTISACRQHLKALVVAGQIQAEGATVSRVYFTTAEGDQAAAAKPHGKASGTRRPLPEVKRTVMNAIARDPGALTEDRLALALGLDREDVAVATGELLDEGELVLQPDATYTIDRGGGGRSVDLKDRIMSALARCSSSWRTLEVAYQTAKDGHGAVDEQDAKVALLELERDGLATQGGGFNGKSTWRAAE